MGQVGVLIVAILSLQVVAFGTAIAADDTNLFDNGRLLATGGVAQFEGATGGGLAAWALIAGYGTRDAIGADAHYGYVGLRSFDVQSGGAAIGFFNRLELSVARLAFDTQSTGGKLGLGSGFTFNETVLGAKLRLVGDAVYDQDTLLPQLAVGVEEKTNDRGAIIHAIGGRSSTGTDFYLAATKLFLAESVLVDATIRATRANQFGILGFGGDRDGGYSAEFEGSAAILVSRHIALGAEYRTKPNNLSFAKESNAADVFVRYFATKNLSATAALVDLGDIATQKNQDGVYLSLHAEF